MDEAAEGRTIMVDQSRPLCEWSERAPLEKTWLWFDLHVG